MKKKILLLLMVFILIISAVEAKKMKIKDLPRKSRLWLTRDVVYIISPLEKEVFLQLETEFEREKFIEGFWKQRDPNPNTEENEFKIEHYKRLRYANKHYGKESPGPGWRSEMGRIHILLGKPQQINKYLNSTGIYPTVIWFYSNLGIRGLPNSFNIVFFKKNTGGDYRLYSPVRYGPAELLTNYMGDVNDYNRAYLELHNIEQEVANISLSLLPEESAHATSPSINSEVLLHSKIPKIPYNRAYDNYAKNFLNFKGDVQVSHMENYIKSFSMVKGFYDNKDYGFAHILIEPEKLTIEKAKDALYTIIEVHGNIYNEKNKNIYKYSKKIPVKLKTSQLDAIQKKRFSFQDVFPLLTGKYRYHFLLMNLAGKEFTSVEGKLIIPHETKKAKISTLTLSNRVAETSKYINRLKPFVIKGTQIVPSAKNDFNSFDSLHLYFQITGLTREIIDSAIIEYSIIGLKKKNIVFKLSKSLKSFNSSLNFFDKIQLKKIPADFYSIRVVLKNREGKVLSKIKEDFYIAITNIIRPWVMSAPATSKLDAQARVYSALGKQLFSLNKLEKSLYYFEKAFHTDKTSLIFAIDYINNLLKLKRYSKAKSIILPLLSGKHRNKFLLISAKISFVLKDYNEAIKLFNDYLTHFGSKVEILNMLAECYIRTGKVSDAITILKKSLKKLPNQPKIKITIKKLEDIKNAK